MAIKNRLQSVVAATISWEEQAVSHVAPRRHYAYKLLKEIPPSVKAVTADKNFGLVLLDLTTYNLMVLKHLQNPNDYTLVPDPDTIRQGLLRKHWELYTCRPTVFSEQALKFAATTGSQWPKFHVLPKLHKGYTSVSDISTRPIAGAVNWVTTKWSVILDTILSKIPCRHVIKNTTALIRNISNIQVPVDCTITMFSADADALYTNIDIKTLKDILCNHWSSSFKSNHEIINFVLDNSYVQYNGKVYHQKRGIAMGTNCAVTLANLYLDNLVDHQTASDNRILCYYRYIDDVFGIFLGNQEEARAYLSHALQKPNINLRWNFHFCERKPQSTSVPLPFLDASLWVQENLVCTRPFRKQSSRGLYLPFSSAHPLSTLKGIIRGESIRFLILSSHESSYNAALAELWSTLQKCGYPRRIWDQVQKPLFSDRNSFLELHERDTQPKQRIIPFVIPFSFRPILPTLMREIHKINELDSIKNADVRFLTAYRKSPSIRDLICRSSLSTQQVQVVEAPDVQPNLKRKPETEADLPPNKRRPGPNLTSART
jgi:hypothetical protein